MISATIFLSKRHSDLADALKAQYELRFPSHRVAVTLVDGLIQGPVLSFDHSMGLPTLNPHTGDLVPIESGKEQREFLLESFRLLFRQVRGRNY